MMDIDTHIIETYFDCRLEWNNDVPKLKIQLKDVYKGGKPTPFRPNDDISKKIPYSGIQREYYMYYFDDVEMADIIYTERKKLASKHSQLKWWIAVSNLDDKIIDKIEIYLYNIGNKVSKKLCEHYNSSKGDITREKLKNRSMKWAPIIGKMNSDRWNDIEWRDNEMKRRRASKFYEKVAEKNKKRMSDSEYYERFMKSMNNPERIEKISNSSKKMWKRMKRDKPDSYYRIINSGSNKNFTVNGYNMNMIEYIIATTLNDMSIDWEYEQDFNFDGLVYIPDFFLPKKNLIIECYGDYWHANPEIYSSGQSIFKHLLVDDVWDRDNVRKTTFIKNGYSFLSFWETDIRNNINNIKKIICQNI
jgi:G:T-mismatch repair DNA endonuclease (very short patch repair protein)